MDCEDIDDVLENSDVQYREMKEVLIKKCRAINAKEAEDQNLVEIVGKLSVNSFVTSEKLRSLPRSIQNYMTLLQLIILTLFAI